MSQNQNPKPKSEKKNKKNKQKNVDMPTIMKAFTDAIKSLKKKEGDKVNTPDKAVALFNSDQDYKQDIIDIIDKAKSKTSRRGILLRRIEASLGEKFVSHYYPEYFNMNDANKMDRLACLLTDDLGILSTAAKYAVPTLINLAKEHGPSVLNWLYDKWQFYHNNKTHGSGTGLVKVVAPNSIQLVDNNTVCPAYLAFVFDPEGATCAQPTTLDTVCASMRKTVQYDLTTGLDGNLLFYMIDDGAFNGTATNTNYFIAVSGQFNTSNITTGLASGYTYLAGPYATAPLDSAKSTAISTCFIPSQALLNLQGRVVMAHIPNAVTNTMMTPTPAIPFDTIMNCPYLQAINLNGTKEVRQLSTFTDPTDLSFDDTDILLTQPPFNSNGYKVTYISVIGATPQTIIGNVMITVGGDAAPEPQLYGVIDQKQTPNAPATMACYGAILKAFPQITQLKREDSKKLRMFIQNLKSTQFSEVYSAICGHLMENPVVVHKETSGLMEGINALQGGDEVMSFEME